MLKVDQKKILKLPNLWPSDLYNADLIRIGTIGEGSCFFHSLFQSLNKNNYVSLSISDRKKMIREERRYLSTLSAPFYLKTANSVMNAQQRALLFYKKLYSFLENFSINMNMILKKEYQKEPILKKLLGLSLNSLKKCLPHSFTSFENNVIDSPLIGQSSTVDEWQQNFLTVTNRLSVGKASICSEMIEELVNGVNQKIKWVNTEKFKEMVSDPCEFVSDEFLRFLADHYNLDIYFIDVENGKIYMAHENLLKGDRPSVIVATIDNMHFETIGLQDRGKKEIVTVFSPEHPLISNLYRLIKEKKPKGDKNVEDIKDIKDVEDVEDKTFMELYDLLMPLIETHPDDHEENIKRLTLLVNVAHREIGEIMENEDEEED